MNWLHVPQTESGWVALTSYVLIAALVLYLYVMAPKRDGKWLLFTLSNDVPHMEMSSDGDVLVDDSGLHNSTFTEEQAYTLTIPFTRHRFNRAWKWLLRNKHIVVSSHKANGETLYSSRYDLINFPKDLTP